MEKGKLLVKINSPLSMTIMNVNDEVKKALSFTTAYWKNGRYGKERNEYEKSFLLKGTTLTGFLPRLRKQFNVQIVSQPSENVNSEVPFLPVTTLADGNVFLDFREDQKVMLEAIRKYKRGVIHGFTGVGKSVVALGTIQAFSPRRFLLLCHTTAILDQLASDLEQFDFEDVDKLYGGNKKLTGARVVLGTRQTVANMVRDGEIQPDYIQGLIVDECHHIADLKGQYGQVLSYFPCPIRAGFTATMPNPKEQRGMTIEGLLGPVISQLSLQEGKKLGLLAEPRICIRRIDRDWSFRQWKTYAEVKTATAESESRNIQIANDVAILVREGMKVLVLVVALRQGENLQRLIRERIDSPVLFMRGVVDNETRESTRKMLIEGKTKCVVASVVWREGVNIRDLDVIVNAAGSKEEIAVMQGLGRGLRKTEDKDDVLYVDYFDESHYYLVKHFGTRLVMFMNEGWKFTSMQEFIDSRKEKVNLVVRKREAS